MGVRGLVLAAIFSGLVATCCGEILFSQLNNTLTITTSPSGKVNLKAGEGTIKVSWEAKKGIDTSSYKTLKVKLCFKLESQKDRPWRKTEDHLNKDKTCTNGMATVDFKATNKTVTYKVKKNVPTAHYFIRAYALDANNKEVAYGQTVDSDQFSITAITGRHVSLDIASAAFSAFSIISLAGFFYLEKQKGKRAS